jgi:hypothetical protein
MIEQKFSNKARLVGYTIGAVIVAVVVIVKLIAR